MRIVVFTYDKCSWLIPIFWHFYRKNWKNNQYATDFVTETERIIFGDSVFYAGKISWSDRIVRYLDRIKDNNVLLIGDDYIIRGVDQDIIKKAEYICKDDIGCIRLSNHNRHSQFLNNIGIDGFKNYPLDKPYSMALDIAIWQKSFLMELLKPGENPWETESRGSKRIQDLNKKVLWSDDIGIDYPPGGCMCKGKLKIKEMEWIRDNWD